MVFLSQMNHQYKGELQPKHSNMLCNRMWSWWSWFVLLGQLIGRYSLCIAFRRVVRKVQIDLWLDLSGTV